MHDISRLRSGIGGLDDILAGGFVAGASYIIQGQPGAGKTILSNQIAFRHVADGGRVLYVTLLAESHERLFQTLDPMTFFDRARLGNEITYVSVFQTLRDEGLQAVVKLLRRETRRQEATLLVFDGLLNARDRAETDFDVKTFVAEIQGQAAFVGCSVLFLSSSSIREISPEHTMVDGVLELSDTLIGVRSVRQIQVRKSRGSRAIGGLHEFEISDAGISVYPRIEAQSRPDPATEVLIGRVASGLPKLDELLGGGLPIGSVTLLSGPTGSGKTTLGLHFLSRSTPEQPGLYFGFFENPARLRAKAQALGIPFPEGEGLTAMWSPLTDNIVDKLACDLLEQVRTTGVKRLFIDGFGGFERAAVHRSRLIEFFASLSDRLREIGVTTLATWEIREIVGADVTAPAREISAILDNMILLRQIEEDHRLTRSISIQKVRDGHFDASAHALDFAYGGLVINGSLSAFPAVAIAPAGQG